MFQAAKFGDPVLGVDIHMVMVPTPGGPVPTPLPHVFIGVVFDPVGAAMGAALGAVFGGGGPVLINGLPAGNTGMEVKGNPHVPTPPGVSFAPNDVPDHQGTLVTGSKTVSFGGSSAARLTSLVSSCGFPLNLPTSVCLAIPMGAPVLVGGPTSMDTMAAVTRGIRTKWFSDSLKKLLKAGPRLSKIICFLTGHPVDVVTGEVLADALDFELPGPIPISFERNYYSRNVADGPLGPGWHHPLDASIDTAPNNAPNTAMDPRKALRVRLPDGRIREHEALGDGESRWDDIDRYTLARSKRGYCLTFWDGRSLWFEPIPGAPVTHPLVRITDRCWNAVELRYHEGRLSEVTDSMGRELTFTCAGGRLTRIQLKHQGSESGFLDLVRYEYDAEGRLAAAIDPKGNASRYAYKGGVLVTETNRLGLSFHFEYDWYHPEGWCVRTWGDGGIYDRRITYDKHRHLTLVDDTRRGRTHYHGNAAGLVDREVDPTGRETRYEWDESYRKTAEIDGLGNRSEWAYDRWGNVILERNALGQETRRRFNEHHLPTERLDAAGGTWARAYDARGKLIKAVDPLGNATRFKHDRRGNLTTVEDPLGRTLSLRYDAAGGLAAVIDWEQHATRYEQDERGQVIRQFDALGGETVITRDACGRPVTVRRPDGSITRLAYDAEGNLTERTDSLGNTTRFRYGGLNKLVEKIDPAGGVVRHVYDGEEALTSVINEAGEAYRIELDLAGRVVKELGFDGRALEFSYDRAGRCIETVSAQKKRTRIERDALGRVIKQVIPKNPVLSDPLPAGDEVTFAYDALGGMVLAKNGAAEIVFTRDALGRVIEERSDEQVITSRYDAAGNRIGRKTSLGQETAYDFDGNGGLLGLTFGVDARWMDFSPPSLEERGPVRAPWKATFARDAMGNEQQRHLPGDVESHWMRDVLGRPMVHRVLSKGTSLLGTGYKWRGEEQIAAMIDTQVGAVRFEHDARSFLVAATWPDGSTQHRAPDAVGNLFGDPERWDRSYGKGGRVIRVGGTRYEHDADGQLVAKVGADGKRWGYAWDHAGQLQEVTRPDGEKVRFAYDALGRRVRKTFSGKTTRYVWDENDLVHEVVEGAPLITWEMEPGSFAPVAKVEGEKRYGVVTDHLGAPRVLLDEVGELAWKAQLDVYGVARVDVMKTSCPWRWPGQYEDEETGLYYNRFRYYDPGTGRYISQDPIRLKGGLDIYGYVSDPLSLFDPLGLSECGWSNKRVKDAAKALERGETSVWVKTRSEAEELLLGRYIGGNDASEMFRNTTGLTAMETKSILGSKANTYHWDDALDALGRLADHEIGHADSKFRHLQIHPREGSVTRIFFGDPLW